MVKPEPTNNCTEGILWALTTQLCSLCY